MGLALVLILLVFLPINYYYVGTFLSVLFSNDKQKVYLLSQNLDQLSNLNNGFGTCIDTIGICSY